MTTDKCVFCESNACASCAEFETFVETQTDLARLGKIRRELMRPHLNNYPRSVKFADWLVARVSTLRFFAFCIVLSLIPAVWREHQENVLYVSNIFQLTLLPVILIAQARQAAITEAQREREYRMMLISERIDELEDAGK